MFCSSCGKQINDGARFCEYCGTEQGKSVCISCGKPINSGAKFCEHCGATQTEENTTIPANITPQTVVVSAVSIESDRKSKFTQQEQTKIVGMAASLAATIEVEKEELKRISSSIFQRKLNKPYEVDSWNRDHDSWMKTKQAKIAFVQGDLKETIDALDVLYTTTKIIPTTYRSVDKLIWLYDDMNSSEHDIERAIDLYNHKETSDLLRNLSEKVDDVRGILAVGFTAVYSAIEENTMIQSELLSSQQEIIANQHAMLYQQSEMLSNLERVRKSARTGNILSVANLLQNHKRNKMLSDIHKGFS